MSVNQAFLLATRNGGLALRRPDLGVITEGAKADLVIWDGESPSLLGWRDPVAAVILHANVGDVEHVLVDGKFVKRDGKIVAPEYQDIKERFLNSYEALQDRFIAERPWRAPEEGESFGEFGVELMEVIEVDTQRGEGTGYGERWL
jgi:adenine deaminase